MAAAEEAGSGDALSSSMYRHLQAIAGAQMAHERRDHTLSATALVHEIFIKFGGDLSIRSNPAGFYNLAADAMRRVLIDHARRRDALKRGGPDGNHRPAVAQKRLSTFESFESLAAGGSVEEMMALHAAILRLEEQDARAAGVVRLRFFTGLSIEKAAEILGISERTAKRDWEFARAFLFRELGG